MVVAIVSCDQNTVTTPSSTVTLTVSAAASLKDVMQDIQSTYSQEQPQTNITYNFASSGSLQQQIEQGAPVDVFVSAARKQMNALEQKNLLLAGTRKDLLGNEVVLITSGNAKILGFADLKRDQVKQVAIAEPKSVPAGQYGQEVLTTLNLFDTLRPKLVFAKDVRQVLSYVETGNVDAGIVYATDAKTSQKVKIVATAPKNSHSPIAYPVAILQDSKQPDAAKKFVDFLSSDQAQATFKQAGFITIHQ
ncbi:Molybdenum ABC transporter, substrate-binding protein ModA [uncultured Synechococcales cyanobacterium]|uniref:Molybdenum ABC transporter, substrate-binding protein ModA n=1 Tax=uncultured Synechococcales cyanobacterium TaxID=1936017 RepID=A0A6J4UPT3_9CYAN|nr:Molybdenum ABC transporter, substrate-binding protein ModA [uncultured Synechococcales cyanobacterium]